MNTGQFAVAAVIAIISAPSVTNAAEIKLLSAVALQSVMEELAPLFGRATGNKLSVSFGVSSVVKRQIDAGENFDVVIHQRDTIEQLLKQGKIAGRAVDLVRSSFGLAVRSGARKPDISTVEAFKITLYAARSIAYSEGPSGRHFLSLLQRLGVAEDIRPKTRPVARRPVAEIVANGEAELGIHQIGEILPVAGAELVGPLPAELQHYVVYTAGIGSISQQPKAAENLITFFATSDAVRVLKAKGMEPTVPK